MSSAFACVAVQLQPGLKRKAGLHQLATVQVIGGERMLRRDKFSING